MRVFTCIEINRFLKQGHVVTARATGFDGERKVLKARVGMCDTLQVKIEVEGQTYWRTSDYSSVRVEEACAKS